MFIVQLILLPHVGREIKAANDVSRPSFLQLYDNLLQKVEARCIADIAFDPFIHSDQYSASTLLLAVEGAPVSPKHLVVVVNHPLHRWMQFGLRQDQNVIIVPTGGLSELGPLFTGGYSVDILVVECKSSPRPPTFFPRRKLRFPNHVFSPRNGFLMFIASLSNMTCAQVLLRNRRVIHVDRHTHE